MPFNLKWIVEIVFRLAQTFNPQFYILKKTAMSATKRDTHYSILCYTPKIV